MTVAFLDYGDGCSVLDEFSVSDWWSVPNVKTAICVIS